MANINDTYTLYTHLRGARGVIGNLNSISRALDTTQIAATRTFQIDRQVKNVAIQMGYTATETQKMTDSITGLSNATGLSTTKTGELVSAMAAAGLAVDSLDESLRGSADAFNTISDGAARHLETMAELVGRHGLSASAAVQTTISLQNMGASLTDLTDDVTKWQKVYKVPGLLNQIPQAVTFAHQSLSKFGHLVVGDSRKLVESTLKLGATFSKVYGVDISAAIQMAQQHQEHFIQQTAQNTDVFLGLSDSFSPLTNALFEAGMQFDEVSALMKKGQEDPLAFAENILKMEEHLRQTQGDLFADRFHQNILRNSSEQVKTLLEEDAARARLASSMAKEAEEKDKLDKSNTAFASMTKSLRDVGATAIETFNNVLMLGKTLVGLTFADDVAESFKGLHHWVSGLNVRIRNLALTLKENETFKEWLPTLQKVGKALIMLGATAGALAGSFAAVTIPLKMFSFPLVRIIARGGKVASVLQGIGSAASFLGKKILLPISLLGLAARTLDDFGAQLKDPTLTGPEKLVRGIRSVFVGLVDGVDSLLMGIPSRIARFFFPSLRGSLSDGVKRVFNKLLVQMKNDGVGTFSSVFASIQSWTSEKLDQIWAWMQGKVGGWKDSAGEMGKNVGRALGQLARWAWDGMKWLFSPATWRAGWNKIVAWFNGEGGPIFSESLQNIFFSALDVTGSFLSSMTDEILSEFGYSFVELRADVEDVLDWFRDKWDQWNYLMVDPIKRAMLLTWAEIKEGMAKVKYLLSSAWDDIKTSVAESVGSLLESSVGPLIKGYAEVVFQYERFMYAIGQRNEQQIALATKQYNSTVATADGLGKSIADSAKSALSSSTIDYQTALDEAQKARTDYETFTREANERELRNKETYERRAAERAERKRTRRAEAQRAGREGREARETERLRRIEEAAKAEEQRKPIVEEIQSILKVAEGYRDQAAQAGNRAVLQNIEKNISRIDEVLDYAQLSNNPGALRQYVDYVRKLVGDQVVDEARRSREAPAAPGPGTEGAYAPAQQAPAGNYVSAPARVGSTPIAAASAPPAQAGPVPLVGRTTGYLELILTPEARELFRNNKVAAATEVTGMMGGG